LEVGCSRLEVLTAESYLKVLERLIIVTFRERVCSQRVFPQHETSNLEPPTSNLPAFNKKALRYGGLS
jgi:hypothetical protein